MTLIIHIAKQFPGLCWYNYDRAFRLQATASNLINWTQINSDLYHCHTSVAVQTSRPQTSRSANVEVIRVPRLHANHGMQGLQVVLTNFVDFATNVTGRDVMAHIAASSARNSFVNEGVVRETSKAVGDTQITISRDGENSTNIFSYLSMQNTFKLPDVSSFTPIIVDNMSVQLGGHPDPIKVDYVLKSLRNGF